jgi:hypothetical protein
MLFFIAFENEKNPGIMSNDITYEGLRRLHKNKIFSRNNVECHYI